MDSPVVLLVGQAVLILTTVLGFAFQLYRESRNRKWDLEDRAIARLDMTKKADEVRSKLELATKKAAEDRHQIADTVTAKIEENTVITTKALEEASRVSQKIEGIKEGTLTIHQRIEDILKSFDTINGASKLATVESVVIKTESVIVEHPGKVTT